MPRLLSFLKFCAPFSLAAVFLVSGLDKLFRLDEFIASLHARSFLPSTLIWAGIILVPGLEVITGLAFLNRLHLREAACLVGPLLLVFIVVTVADAVFPSRGTIGCGCMSFLPRETSSGPSFGWLHILFLIFLAWLNYLVLLSTGETTLYPYEKK